VVLDSLARGSANQIAGMVQASVRDEQPSGVVILGGYDVVPPAIVDVLDPQLRASLADPAADADNFIVWSDDIYVDRDAMDFPNCQ